MTQPSYDMELSQMLGSSSHYNQVFDRAYAAVDGRVPRDHPQYHAIIQTCMCLGNWQLAHREDIADVARTQGLSEEFVLQALSHDPSTDVSG